VEKMKKAKRRHVQQFGNTFIIVDQTAVEYEGKFYRDGAPKIKIEVLTHDDILGRRR
jgi:hypothetical protein